MKCVLNYHVRVKKYNIDSLNVQLLLSVQGVQAVRPFLVVPVKQHQHSNINSNFMYLMTNMSGPSV